MQLDLFTWAQPATPAPRTRAYGWKIAHPCACGSVHSMIWLDYPYSMISLRWWRISKIQRRGAA